MPAQAHELLNSAAVDRSNETKEEQALIDLRRSQHGLTSVSLAVDVMNATTLSSVKRIDVALIAGLMTGVCASFGQERWRGVLYGSSSANQTGGSMRVALADGEEVDKDKHDKIDLVDGTQKQLD